MTFATPELLWLLLAPVALLIWELTQRRSAAATSRPNILRAEAGAHSLCLSNPKSEISNFSSRPRPWLFTGLTLVVLALARPQYGRLEEPVFDQSREILLGIDLSRSMLVPDVKPSRLERSKLLIQSLLEKLEGERVGLVVFAGTAFLQSPLSADYEILREFLPALNPEFLPQGGTNYGALLTAALQAFSATNSADRFLVILSDGEATDEDWKSRIEDLKKKNIRVLGLGVGTAGGAMIPDGSGGFAKDERGAVVLSKLESGTLQELATTTGGVYRDASGWLDLAALVKETVEAGRKGQFLEKNTIRLAERFQWPLALGVWCLLVSFYREFPVRPKPRNIKLTAQPKSAVPTAPRPTATASAMVLLVAFLLNPPAPTYAIIPPTGAPTTKSTNPAASPPSAPPASAELSKIVGRLAASPTPAARDWAELGRETVSWGSRLQSEQQPIPDGPVRDALAAVDAGATLDPKTADWPKLRSELEALLKKSEDQKQEQQKQQDDQNKQDQQDKDQDQKNQDQKKQEQQKSDEKKSQDQKDQQQSQEKPEQQKQQEQDQQKPDDQQKPGDSAFGDMKDKQPPPPPPQPDPGTQKVGGQPERKPEDQQPADPSLALPLQKLEQLRNQDSPAHLFQLMEGEKKPATKTKGKDW